MKIKTIRVFFTLITLQSVLFRNIFGFKFLILHPVYSGSHVLTVHHISRELVNRGHEVLTIRYKDTHQLQLEDPDAKNEMVDKDDKESNKDENKGKFREYLLSLNNSEGKIPYVTVEEDAKFVIPSDLLWSEGTMLSALFKLPENPWRVLKGTHFGNLSKFP